MKGETVRSKACNTRMEKAAKQTRGLMDKKKDTMEPGNRKALEEQSGNESLPEWFHGLMSRREADEILKNQDIGKFFIRLSERTFGYILSYNFVNKCLENRGNGNDVLVHWCHDRVPGAPACQSHHTVVVCHRGKERCRHFVVNQLQSGELVVTGDNCSHSSLPDLISHYQTSPIEPYGEKLTQCCIKFSDYNMFDEIKPRTEELNKSDSAKQQNNQMKIPDIIPKNKRGSAQLTGQEKHLLASAQGSAPPLPDRNRNQFNMDENEEDIYSMPTKVPMDPNKSRLVAANKHQEEMANEAIYSQSNKTGVIYSQAKEAQINQNVEKASVPQVVYSEVKLDKSLPSALGHLQSKSGNYKEARKLALDARSSRGPNVKEVSQYKVMEMKFASSLQCTNIHTFSNEVPKNPLLSERVEMPGGSFLHPATVSQSDISDTYEHIPFSGLTRMGECAGLDQISNISLSCTTYDHVTTRTSKEVVTENLYEKMPLQNTLQDSTYEMVTRGFAKPAGKKNAVNKNEKHKRFFFADRKK